MTPLGLHLTPGEVQAFRAGAAAVRHRDRLRPAAVFQQREDVPDGRTYLLQVGVSLAPMDAALSALSRSAVVARAGWRCWSRLAAWWLSGFALRPLSRLAARRARSTCTTLERRLPVRGVGDELDRVAEPSTSTLGRLEHAVGRDAPVQRRAGARAAHAFGGASRRDRAGPAGARREPRRSTRRLASQIEEIDRLTRLIDQILTLARAEAGPDSADAGAGRSRRARRVARRAARTDCGGASIELRCEPSEAVVVTATPAGCKRLLLNLLDNALKFTPASGRVAVRVSRERDAARIDVRDTGVGLSPGDAQRVFERFFRADPARSSSIRAPGSVSAWSSGSPRSIAGPYASEPARRRLDVHGHAADQKSLTDPNPHLMTASRAGASNQVDARMKNAGAPSQEDYHQTDNPESSEGVMEIEQRTVDDVLVLSIRGDITMNGTWEGPLSDIVRSAVQEGHDRFVLDLGCVPDADSIGLGELVQALVTARIVAAR